MCDRSLIRQSLRWKTAHFQAAYADSVIGIRKSFPGINVLQTAMFDLDMRVER